MPKTRITLTIDEEIYQKAKQLLEERKLTLSGVIEHYLSFLLNPYVYCFNCGEKFHVKQTEECPTCGWLQCPHCKACRCQLSDEAAKTAYHMRKLYEDLLHHRVAKR